MSNANEIYNKLSQPFPEEQIEWRIAQSGEKNGTPWGKVLAYVDNRAIMDRLDQVVGNNNWQEEYRQIGISDTGFICRLGVRIEGEWIWKEDGANVTQFEAIKGGLSGAMKRTAVKFGIGRYLYGLDQGWANFVDNRKNARYSDKINGTRYYWNPPSLPSWALPKEKHEFLDDNGGDIELHAQPDWASEEALEKVLSLIEDGKKEEAKQTMSMYKWKNAYQEQINEAWQQ